MIRPKLLICAEGIVIDQKSNNVSAFNILEQLNFESLPVVFPKIEVLSVFERDEGDPQEYPVSIRITIAGSEILNQTVAHNFRDKKRSRNMFTVGGLPITQPGTLKISVCKGNESLISYTVEVTVPKKAAVKSSTPKNTTVKNTTSKEVTVKST